MALPRRRAAAKTARRIPQQGPPTGLRVTLWVGLVLAVAALSTFVVSAAFGGWTGLGLLVFGGAILLVAGIALALALLGSAQRGAVFPHWEHLLGVGTTLVVAAVFGGVALLGEGAAWVYRITFGILALVDLIAAGAVLRVEATGRPPQWMGQARWARQ